MRYNKHRLFIEKVNAQSIAKKIDTPFYCYSFNKLKTNINNFKKNFNKIDPLICFSVKSNNNLYILRIIKKFGLGADVVSKGELLRALKAGISPEKIFLKIIKKFNSSSTVNIRCLSVHIGSQILDHKPYLRMIRVIENILKKSKNKFDYIDLGGGMGIDYGLNSKKLNYKKYSSSIESLLKKYKVKFIFEPGRSIIGDTACLITKVIYVKSSTKKNFIILDSAMIDFMRPALYGSLHRIIPTVKNNKILKKVHDFVGPICETTDRFLTLKK